ncbi:Guanylate kinase [Paramyrothecium foliicola]|nr:Guanylate kinase [Paramyrothecium foliicola]
MEIDKSYSPHPSSDILECVWSLARLLTAPPDRRPIVISGPSGVGKSTLYKQLFARHPDDFALAVSHTTRPPRPGEKDGVDYYFVTREIFSELLATGAFIEHATYGGNCYGTSKSTIEEQTRKGRVVLLDIEMEGIKQVKQSGLLARYLFVAPPSFDVLEARLRGRGTESEESIQKRLGRARLEMEFAQLPGVHDGTIISDHAAFEAFEKFVYQEVAVNQTHAGFGSYRHEEAPKA